MSGELRREAVEWLLDMVQPASLRASTQRLKVTSSRIASIDALGFCSASADSVER